MWEHPERPANLLDVLRRDGADLSLGWPLCDPPSVRWKSPESKALTEDGSRNSHVGSPEAGFHAGPHMRLVAVTKAPRLGRRQSTCPPLALLPARGAGDGLSGFLDQAGAL